MRKEATRETPGALRNVWLYLPCEAGAGRVEGLIRSQRLHPGGRRAPSTQRASPCHQSHSCCFDTAPVNSLRVGNIKVQTHQQAPPREPAPPECAGAPAGPPVALHRPPPSPGAGGLPACLCVGLFLTGPLFRQGNHCQSRKYRSRSAAVALLGPLPPHFNRFLV